MHVYWWWLNSMATQESITRDLEEMKDKGYGGATIFDAGSSSYTFYGQSISKTAAGPVFMSNEWMELYKHTIREADRLGLEISMNLQSGWNPGAPCVTPKDAAKTLTTSMVEVVGGKRIEIELPMPPNKLLYSDVLVQAYPIEAGKIDTIAIQHFAEKALYRSMGSKGSYPLHILEEDTPLKPQDLVINPTNLIDLTAHVKDGKLTWNAPAGRWKVVRYGMTCTGVKVSTSSDNWKGLSFDHLSRNAFQLFADSVILPLIHTAKREGNSLRYIHTDSWEMGAVNWTPLFMEEFKAMRGYDMKPFMPAMTGRIVESKEITNRFLRDVRRTIADLVYRNHYKLMSDIAHNHGIGIHPESGGPHSAPVDGLEMMGLSDIPTGEFWATANTHRVLDDERLAVRQAASAAHTHGRRLVQAEGPTSIGPQWERTPRDLKTNIDRIFCSGVNRILWHTFTSSPKEFGTPGNEYFAGTHLNPNTTWWPYAADFISYLNRCSQLLSEGLYQADVAIYYGDNAPNYVFLKEDKEAKHLPFGYAYDKISKNVLLERAYIKNGRLTLADGMNYRVLMLHNTDYIDPALLGRIEEWVNQGLVVLGRKPTKAVSALNADENDQKIRQIADRLWNESKRIVGKGAVYTNATIADVLNDIRLTPDFRFSSLNTKTKLDFIHRYTHNADIYFLINVYSRDSINDYKYRYLTELPDRYESVECAFRVTGKVPEIWNPMTGELRRVAQYREEGGYTRFPITFDPEGSLFVVFRDKPTTTLTLTENGKPVSFDAAASVVTERPIVYETNGKIVAEFTRRGNYEAQVNGGAAKSIQIKTNQKSTPVKGAWKVAFDTQWGGPESLVMKELKPWNEYIEQAVRYYSGTATYRIAINLTKADLDQQAIYLDLGNVLEMARIRVNGSNLGVSWMPPYVVDLTQYVKAGNNELEIDVVNMWVNRLIGDAKLPESKRFTRTNIHKFNQGNDSDLRKSGLIGPVKIITRPRIKL